MSERIPTRRESPWNRTRLALLGLVWLAFAARVWHLGTQSLWLDEALSVVFARPTFSTMLTTLITQDLHPPLYYAILHFWLRLAGQSEFAARFPSVLEGMPVVPATYALGSAALRTKDRVEGARFVGLLGATFVALSPFMVYYAQEARMYSLLASLGVLSSLALWHLLWRRTAWWWVAYVGFTAAMLYTQYFAGLVVAFQGLYLLGTLARDRRVGVLGLSGIAGALVLYLPWLPGAYAQVDRLVRIPDFWKGDFQLSFMVSHIFAAFALGQFAALGALAGVAVALAVAVGLAFVLLAWRAIRHGGGELFLLVYLLVPFAALYIVLVRDPKFTERYLIAIAPPFYLVVALGVVVLIQRARSLRWPVGRGLGFGAGGLMTAALLGASLTQLVQVYSGPGYRKDDNRGAIAYLEQHQQPGDVVILMMNTWETLAYYSRGDLDWAPLQPGGNRESAASELNRITSGHRRLWLVLWNPAWADPSFFVEQSIDGAYSRLPVDRQFTGLDLRLYEIDPAHHFAVQTTPDHPEPVDFGNKLQFLGYDLASSAVVAGQKAKIGLYWKAQGQPDQDYIVSLRLTDGTFQWSQKDDRPAAFTYPTNYWQPNQVIRGDREFEVPLGTPPGVYRLEVGVYAQGGADLTVLRDGKTPAGTTATIAEITVLRPATPPDPAKLGVPPSPNGAFGDLRLLGSRLGAGRVVPGAPIDVTLYWQAPRSSLPREHVQLQLGDEKSGPILFAGDPESGRYPVTSWNPGELVVDRYRVVIPADARPATDHLFLRLNPDPTGTVIDLGSVQVLDHQRLTSPPGAIQSPVNFQVGDFAQLVGYDLSARDLRAGDTLHLTLYWRATRASGSVAYTVFSHLLDRHDVIFAQVDHPPGDGSDPTTGWITGEYVVDHYDLTVNPKAPPGAFRVEVGMYDPATSARLPVRDGAGNSVGDRMLLGTVQVVGP